MLWFPVTSIFIVTVALYWSGSLVSTAEPDVVVGVVTAFAFAMPDAFDELIFVVLLVVFVVLVAGCGWQALRPQSARAINAPPQNFTGGFKAKIDMR